MADGTYLTIFPKFRFKLNTRITRKATLQNRILLRNKKSYKKFNYLFLKTQKLLYYVVASFLSGLG